MWASASARAQATPTETPTETPTPTATQSPMGTGSGGLSTSSSTLTPTVTPTRTPTVTPTPIFTTDVLTYHNDNARTGQNLNETILTPDKLKPGFGRSGAFGKLFEVPVDGKVDAQPLIKTQVDIPGQGVRNVLYVVTEHDSVYAFDAGNGSPLWPAPISLLGAGETPSDPRGCGQVVPEIGITSTPVIDPNLGPHGTMFVVAMSKDAAGHHFQRIHALDITTGAEEFGGPVVIAATYPGSGDGSVGGVLTFKAGAFKERAGLVEVNGNVYTTWASHCDIPPYTGWIIGYGVNAPGALVQTSILNITPNGNDGAIWAAGAGPAADDQGNIYVLDGNGTFDTTLTAEGFPINGDFGNGFLKLSTAGGLQVADYFEPFDTVDQSAHDRDLGSGGALVLPDMTDAPGATRHLVVGAGKDGKIYLADRDNMGKFNPADNSNIYQELVGALPNGEWGMPAYFNSMLYYGGIFTNLKAFTFSNALLNPIPLSSTAAVFAYPGTTPSVSAWGTKNAIVWAVRPTSSRGILYAYDAYNLGIEYYNSDQAPGGRDWFQDNKFITPTIANGKVYIGTPNSVAVFGLLGQGAAPARKLHRVHKKTKSRRKD